MRELELKFRILDKCKFLETLKELGIKLSESVQQQDRIFLQKGTGFKDLKLGKSVIRVRNEKNELKCTIKRYRKGVLDREEVEFTISDEISFEKFLYLLDYVSVVTVCKSRKSGRYCGATIVMDYVDGLGEFTEIEIVSKDDDVEENLCKLERIASDLKLDMKDLIQIPYDEMLFMERRK